MSPSPLRWVSACFAQSDGPLSEPRTTGSCAVWADFPTITRRLGKLLRRSCVRRTRMLVFSTLTATAPSRFPVSSRCKPARMPAARGCAYRSPSDPRNSPRSEARALLASRLPDFPPRVLDRAMNRLLDPKTELTPEAALDLTYVGNVLALRNRYARPEPPLTDPDRHVDLSLWEAARRAVKRETKGYEWSSAE